MVIDEDGVPWTANLKWSTPSNILHLITKAGKTRKIAAVDSNINFSYHQLIKISSNGEVIMMLEMETSFWLSAG